MLFFFHFISFHFQKIILIIIHRYILIYVFFFLFCRAYNVDRWGTRNVHRQGQYDESHLRGTSQSWTTDCHLLDPWWRGIELLIYQYMHLKCVHANYFMLFRIYDGKKESQILLITIKYYNRNFNLESKTIHFRILH